jgi:hypothetical protein
MKVALYVGDHKGDSLFVRLGWFLTRLTQRGAYRNVTHSEAILDDHPDGTTTIGSSSLREGGVRMKRCTLNRDNWMVVNVPTWSAEKAKQWFIEHEGVKYDSRGALATVLPALGGDPAKMFCHEAVGESVEFRGAALLTCSEFAEVVVHFGEIVA